jgi:group II intron reverse transcriptase/maturase
MVSDYVNRRLEAIGKVSKKGKKIVKLYDLLSKKEIWFQAYQNIYGNKGSETPGVDGVTMDGFSEGRVEAIIKLLKEQLYTAKPTRRVLIPKANGKMRPLGIPSGWDKLVQEAIRIILERIYEPVFSERSHGFRPGRSCHTALSHIATWTATRWFVEFDIKGYYDNIDHNVLISLLKRRIDDPKFLNLIKNMLRAGYMQDWKFHRTYSGAPQGGIVSPILANIYLHELDVFVENMQAELNCGKRKKVVPEYNRICKRMCHLRKEAKQVKERLGPKSKEFLDLREKIKLLTEERMSIRCNDPMDPKYKRLWYCRYADDFLLGVIGSIEDATQIENRIRDYLDVTLKLQVSEEKTGIRHAKTGVIFLGYQIHTYSGDRTVRYLHNGTYTKKRSMPDRLELLVPTERIQKFCKDKHYGFRYPLTSKHRTGLISLSDAEIISTYNAELRGFANYYALAKDVKRKLNTLFYIAHYSLFKTLAAKHKSSVSKVISKLRDRNGFLYMYEAGGKVKSIRVVKLKDLQFNPANADVKPNTYMFQNKSELLTRLMKQQCEYCGKQDGYFEVHHIRKLSDIKAGKELWQMKMIQRRRKTLILCVECHDLLHAGKLPDWRYRK